MLSTGTRVGPYVVETLIGQGGMGEVYRAHDSRLNRDVALKVLPPSFVTDRDRLARFDREAQLLASLNHPHIATVHGVEESDGTRALVMELVDGPTLADRLDGGAIPFDEALPIARQIAGALEAAHESGIVHRDLKPANVKVRPDGTVKVLDFGLAKALESNLSSASSVGLPTITSPAMTGAGVILGTAAYMAPEQATGKPVDKRADIWAFGCVLYEMLTGRRAFGGEGVTETLTAVLRDTPNWHALPASTPAGVRRLLARCLERDPRARLRDIGDARLDMAGAGDDAPVESRPVDSHRRRWIYAALCVALGVAVVGAAVGATLRQDATLASVVRTTVVPPADLPLMIDPTTPDMAIMPDGSRIVYQSRRLDPEGARIAATQLVFRGLGAFEASPLPGLGQDPEQPFASPDGAWIGFATTVGDKVAPVLAKVPASGGPLTVVDDLSLLGGLRGASWTADGRIVFATAQITTGLMQVPATGGRRVQLTTPDKAQGERDHVWPEVLPRNAGTLFTIMREAGRFDVAVLPAGESRWRVIIPGGTMPHYLSSGHLLYVVGDVLYAAGFDLRSLTVTTEPKALLRGVLVKDSGAADYSVASNGTLVYVPGTYQEKLRRLVWVQGDGTTSALPLDTRTYESARLSPDGRRIAALVRDRGFGSLWMYDIERDTFMRLTTKEESVGSPLWSPDSKRLVFWSERDKGLFTIAADGSDRSDRLAASDNGVLYPSAWSNDGATIAFISSAPSLNLLAVPARPPYVVRPLATGAGAQVEAAFSPDGRWLVHISFDGRVPEVVVGPVAGGHQWPIAPTGRDPVWMPDGRGVMYRDGGAVYRVAIESATGMPIGRPTRVLQIPSQLASGTIEMSADGRRFLMIERLNNDDRQTEMRVVQNWIGEVRAAMAGAPAAAKRP